MGIERFDLGSVSKLDSGRIKEAWEQALKRCMDDCKDRPAVADPRKVQLLATVSPVVGDNGELESCDVHFQIADAVPKRKSKIYNMKSKGGALFFNELSPEDIHQRTLDDAPKMKAVSHAR
jgi:hypothetical protein